ncbi:7514_t:CDS:2 [Acaulospora morrowiae]|uniref:7514_t:CDS:1 n=1 Tax=Acaulospora morrowiae TaxID=94023 RepID=A0A9N9CC38_9GLOM|nr:7514_t:CDS:2 [Acaulospora morrowiae]
MKEESQIELAYQHILPQQPHQNEGTTSQNRPYNSYQSEKSGFSVLDIKALVESALEQANFEPEVVYAAAQLLLLSNPDTNGGYFVDSSSGILDVASNRPSAMSLSNLLLPDDAGSSSKAT